MAGTATVGYIPWGSKVVNGQLVTQAPTQAFNPMIWGPAFGSGGMYPRQGVFSLPPVSPNAMQQQAQAPSSSSGNILPTATSETGNPFHPTKSPLWIALASLVIGVMMLHHIHYR